METETVLLRRFARTGDAEAFGEIIRRHAGLVYGAAWRILADMDRASDVAQETFLQLMKDAAKVTGSLPGWLHRVATHKAIDLVRRDTSRKHRETQYATQQPHQTTSWREISLHVDEGLSTLDAELREILVAHFLEGQSTRQIATVRGISQATVSRRLEAGVNTLRRRLRKRGLLVGAGALCLLLGRNAVNAAPAALKTELGKMALVGGHAATVSASGAVGTALRFQTVIGGALAGVKGKVIAAAAVAAISIGSVATYERATKPAAPEITTRTAAVSPAAPSARRPLGATSGVGRAAVVAGGPYEAVQPYDQVLRATLGPPAPQRAIAADSALDQEVDAATDARYGGAMAGFAMAADLPADLEEDAARTAGAVMGSGDYTSRYKLPVPGPNDANDPNETFARNQ